MAIKKSGANASHKGPGRPFVKGWKGGPGRPKGSKNVTSKEAAQRVLNTLSKLDRKHSGDWLGHIAEKDPKLFAMLLRACLPHDSSVEITQVQGNEDQKGLLDRLIGTKRAS